MTTTPDKFYINWCPTYPQPPKKTYDTPEQAHKVAEEMAKKQPGDEFHVLECIGTYKAEKPVAPVLVKTERKETKKEREEREANLQRERDALTRIGAYSAPKPTVQNVFPNAVINTLWAPSTKEQAQNFAAPAGYRWIAASQYQLGQEVWATTQTPTAGVFRWSRPKVANTQPEADTWQSITEGWYYLVEDWPTLWSKVTVGKMYFHPEHGKFVAQRGPLGGGPNYWNSTGTRYVGWGEIGERSTLLSKPFEGYWSGGNACKYLVRKA